jgi:hypothetical protein
MKYLMRFLRGLFILFLSAVIVAFVIGLIALCMYKPTQFYVLGSVVALAILAATYLLGWAAEE